MSQPLTLNRLPLPLDPVPPISRPADWPPEWVPLSGISEASRRVPVSLLEQPVAGQDAQLVVVLDKSVYTALLNQAYSDTRYDVTGFLGGSWIPMKVQRPRGKGHQWKVVCHVSSFFAAERQVLELLQGRVVEDPVSIKQAVAKFHESDLECVGWYRSNDPSRPLQPTCQDITKQAFLQTLIPEGIGLLVSVASSNNPNRLLPNIIRAAVGEPLKAPIHAIAAYRAGLQTSEGILKTDEIYPPYPEDNPVPFYRDLVYHSDLTGMRIPVGIREQGYMNGNVLREIHRSLQMALNESRQVYLGQASACGVDSARRMFLDSDYDGFLMDFWRHSVIGASNALDQESHVVIARTLWLQQKIATRMKQLKVWYDEAVQERVAQAQKRPRPTDQSEVDQDAMDVDEKDTSDTVSAIEPFDDIISQLRDREATQLVPIEKPRGDDPEFVLSVRGIVSSLEDMPSEFPFKIPRLQPPASRLRELAIFEEEYDAVKDKQKKRAAGRKGAQTRKSRIQKEKEKTAAGGTATMPRLVGKEKGKGKSDDSNGLLGEDTLVQRRRQGSGVAALGGVEENVSRQDAAMSLISLGLSGMEEVGIPTVETEGARLASVALDATELGQPPGAGKPGLHSLLSRSVELLQQGATHLRPSEAENHTRQASGTSRSRRPSKQGLEKLESTGRTGGSTSSGASGAGISPTASDHAYSSRPSQHSHPSAYMHPTQQFGGVMSNTIGPLTLLTHMQGPHLGFTTMGTPPSVSVPVASTTNGTRSTPGTVTTSASPQASGNFPGRLTTGPGNNYPGSAPSTPTPYLNSYIAQRRASLGGFGQSSGQPHRASTPTGQEGPGSLQGMPPRGYVTRYGPVIPGYTTYVTSASVPVATGAGSGQVHYVPVSIAPSQQQQQQSQQQPPPSSRPSESTREDQRRPSSSLYDRQVGYVVPARYANQPTAGQIFAQHQHHPHQPQPQSHTFSPMLPIGYSPHVPRDLYRPSTPSASSSHHHDTEGERSRSRERAQERASSVPPSMTTSQNPPRAASPQVGGPPGLDDRVTLPSFRHFMNELEGWTGVGQKGEREGRKREEGEKGE
ncbi:hypothetical protein SpCBS45565_g08451 [Spizellomyces sp. 'palustris']|nr:hypothetical protein SpCBS45565_g08451 [Spizellomyces sp. 'palustris']